MTPEVVVADRGALAQAFVAGAAAAAEKARGEGRRFSCALPGGSVAEAFLPALAAADLPWAEVDVFFGDERAVGPDDPESNYALACRLLLERVPIAPGRVHRMSGESADLDAAARAYAAEMESVLGAPPRLDLAVLGVGPEGHVCSLFPEHAALAARATVVAVVDSPKPPPRRITMTLAALAGAGTVCVAAFGAAKAAAIREAIEVPDSRLPVALAARAGGRALFLLDPEAASLLRKGEQR